MSDGPILVTGSAGFIGSHLAERLLSNGVRVVGLDNFCDFYDPARKRENVAKCIEHKDFTLVEADIRDRAAIDRVFDQYKPRAVAHLAALANVRSSIGHAQAYAEVNINGSLNLLEAAYRQPVEVFVFASTSSVHGHTQTLPFVETDPCNQPLAPYPATKKAVELLGYTYHNLHGLNFTATRFFSVYGPRGRPDMMPYMLTDRIVRGETIQLFNCGDMKRDWTYVDDIVDGLLLALDRPLGYEVINLGRGEPVLMRDFVCAIEQLTGRKAILETPPAPASEPRVTCADISKARQLLGYDPKTSVVDGLAHMWKWYQDQILPKRAHVTSQEQR
jgi:UDP-glucuronate 4-epimerase